ncbi:hypothetical protein [Leptospira phage LE3]|uniref:Tail fiber protein n=1 Tax=Leptospira phage LE3 TaxID=2041382 RepID=A0A343LE39_9CAUD|nr:tail fiber protein [Leptospira phage LE3]ATN94949.1 hypothetical protein [Leptospira phage LE3]
MSDFSTREQVQKSEVIQDTMPTDKALDGEGSSLSGVQTGTNETLGTLARWVAGISKLLGETSRRKGAGKFHGPDIALTGTITSAGTVVTGSGTDFSTELSIGDFIAGDANEYREVQAIGGPTSLTLVKEFSSDIASAQSFKRIQTLAERLEKEGVGNIQIHIGATPPLNHLLCDGSAISRTTYARLFAVAPKTTSTVTISNATPGVVTWTGHGLKTGHTVQFSTTGALPTGVTSGTVYFIRRIDANTFHLYDTLANAMNTGATTGRVNTSSAGSGVHTGLCYYFGNGDGSTTFNIPDMRGVVPRGVGATAGYVQSASVALGEKIDDAFQDHYHREYYASGPADGAGPYKSVSSTGSVTGITNSTTNLTSVLTIREPVTTGSSGTPRVDTETKGKGLGLNFSIRY